jgi:hypothetical protein
VSVEKQRAGGGVGIKCALALELTQCDQRIEEVTHAARMKGEAGRHRLHAERAVGQEREKAKLHCA